MFPPIEDAVLQNNPKFAALHKTLTTRILNPDGSSKNSTAADREAAAETLRTLRQQAAERQILRSALATLPLSSHQPPLPPDLIELILLLALHLSQPTRLPAATLALLEASPPYAALATHRPRLGALLSAHLHAHALALARLLHPTTNPSFLHRQIPRLGATIRQRQLDVAEKKRALDAQRRALVPLVGRVLEAYRAGCQLIIRILEQKHGQVARHARARGEVLTLEAQQAALETKILHQNVLAAIYTPEVVVALGNYSAHLKDCRLRLKQRQRDAERELERYGVGRQGGEGKEKVMKEIARVYGEMQGQVAEVRKDLERLRAA